MEDKDIAGYDIGIYGIETTVKDKKISDFTSLDAWKEGHRLVLLIYKLSSNFPMEEKYGLSSQIRRAAVSVTSNLAEGFSRFHYRDRLNFYYDTRGSNAEIQNQLIIAKDLTYIEEDVYGEAFNQSKKVEQIVNGLIRKTRSRL